MNQELEASKLIDFLKRNSAVVPKYCDSCGHEYAENSLQIIGNKGGNVSCRLHCYNCTATHILNVAMPMNGVGIASRAPVNVDLMSGDEFNKFAGKPAVDNNDAIETYRTLNKMRGLEDFMKATRKD